MMSELDEEVMAIVNLQSLDGIVQAIASSILQPASPISITKAAKILFCLHEARGEVFYSRAIQEVCAFSGGAVLRALLATMQDLYSKLVIEDKDQGWSKPNIADKGFLDFTACIRAMGILGEHKVAREFLLRDSGVVGFLVKSFACLLYSIYWPDVPVPEVNRFALTDSLVRVSLEGIEAFALTCKVFRDSLRDRPLILQAIKDCLSAGLRDKLDIDEKRNLISRVVLSLASSNDSRLWFLENGPLDLMNSVLITKPADLPFKQDASSLRCCLALICFTENSTVFDKLQLLGGVSFFERHRSLIESVLSTAMDPKLWLYLKARFNRELDRPFPSKLWKKFLKDLVNGSDEKARVVCSWRDCSERPAAPSESLKLSKCARCQIAHYCSKEHQKLHWQTHKGHCKQPGI